MYGSNYRKGVQRTIKRYVTLITYIGNYRKCNHRTLKRYVTLITYIGNYRKGNQRILRRYVTLSASHISIHVTYSIMLTSIISGTVCTFILLSSSMARCYKQKHRQLNTQTKQWQGITVYKQKRKIRAENSK